MPISLLVASPDEHFRESIRESLLNVPNAKVLSEYSEVSANLYIRVLQDLERNPGAALIVDLASDPEGSLRALEKVKQAAPDVYVIASNYHADGETVIASLRAGCSDFLVQPVRRLEFRDAMTRLERAPRAAAASGSRLGRVYSFLGAKGGVGTTTLAVNFAAALARMNRKTVLVDLDFTANDCAMQTGVTPQHTLSEVGENLARLDQALFEGLVIRDPLGFFLVGPPEQIEQRPPFGESTFREFASFLVEKYEAVVIDAGRWISDEVALAALQSSSMVFLVLTQQFPAIRNAQRYIAALMRLGFTQDQLKIVVNQYQKKPDANLATPEQVRQTLNQPVFYGIPNAAAALAAVNRGRPIVGAGTNSDLERALLAFAGKATEAKTAAAQTA
ncbi:MAG: AAA family ATPase [Acidobacteriia bacterium]|nr:AAA family ATPase [Terriglobia bacterium]MBV8903970.1 AAA family ATPase [Terriglobia bacterium]MBV9743723.1 AAA family ATPase [Terriglobia bacterium]